MIFQRSRTIELLLATCSLFVAAGVRAQDPKTNPQEPQQPLSATGVTDSKSSDAVIPYSNEEAGATPDTRPLSGLQKLSLGMSQTDRSFLLPSFTVVGQVQSNPYTSNVAGSQSLTGSGTISGRLALNRTTPATALTLDYLAGATFSGDAQQSTSGIQSLDFSDTFHRGRWSLLAGDQLMYLSQSPFGFGGLGGLGGYGVPLGNGGVGTGSGLGGDSPDQTLFTNGARVSNAVIGQVDYGLTHRSSLTFGVDYGFLKYVDAALDNNSTLAFQTGYNYLLNRKDTISISFHYGRFMFANATPAFESEGVQVGYGRRITSRLSFQAGAGPEFQMFTLPLKGPATLVSWSLSTSLNYQRGTLSLGANYSHALSGGSGVLSGAETDTVTGSLSQTFSHDWNGALSLGYSKNRALEQTNSSAASISPQVWYFAARANRRFFANGSLFVSYALSKQSSLAGACNLPVCQVGAITHTGSVGYSWALHRIELE